MADWIGIVAGTLTTIAFVPQVLRVWRTRTARDLSLATFAIFMTGVALWLVYGVMIASVPIVLANAVTLVLAGSIVLMKIAFDRRR